MGTQKLSTSIEKTKKDGARGARVQKKKVYKKQEHPEDDEITSNDSSIGDNKDDFFIESEEGK